MKKTIQKITGILALSAGLFNHAPAFAKENDGIFDLNEKFPLHFCLKAFSKGSIRSNTESSSLYFQTGIGPTVEWKPLNGLGIQCGLLYTSNPLEIELKIESQNRSNHAKISKRQFHGISVPVYLCFYPGDDRQFVLHAGARWVIPIGDGKKQEIDTIPLTSNKLEMLKSLEDMMKHIGERGTNPETNLKIDNFCIVDLGFDYNAKSGFIIGMNGLGLQLGYDFTKLFIKE